MHECMHSILAQGTRKERKTVKEKNSYINVYRRREGKQYVCILQSSYMTLIGVHVLHGGMHLNQGHITNLFAVDPLSLFGYLPPIL